MMSVEPLPLPVGAKASPSNVLGLIKWLVHSGLSDGYMEMRLCIQLH